MNTKALLPFALGVFTSLSGLAQITQDHCLDFDGNDDNVIITNPLSTGDITIECHILTHSSQGVAIIAQFYDESNGRFEIRMDDGKLSFYIGGTFIQTPFALPLNQFFHLALTKEGQQFKAYADGVLVHSFNSAGTPGSSLQLGRYFDQNTYCFEGQLDDLRLWGIARTLESIQETQCTELTGNEENLVGYWNFNHGTAGSNNQGVIELQDLSLNDNHGELRNFALQGSASNWVTPEEKCDPRDNCLDFDGYDDLVEIINPLNTDSFTIECHILTHNIQDVAVIAQFYDQTNGRFEIRMDDGKLSFYTGGIFTQSNYDLPLNQFFHMALTKQGNQFKAYVDGDLIHSFEATATPGSSLVLGRYFDQYTYSFEGQLDELRLWSVARTPEAIKETKCIELGGNEENLVGYWNFNHGVATLNNSPAATLLDLTSNSNHGALLNFELNGTSSNWLESSKCDQPNSSEEFAQATFTQLAFPNPFQNQLNLNKEMQLKHIFIYDLAGQLVFEQNVNNLTTVQLPDMPVGSYLLIAFNGENKQFHQILNH